MDITNTVAENIKNIRESRKLTLDSAAKLTGVSRSMLAQIEKGDVNPTITVLWKIACGYKVSFTTLTEVHGAKRATVIKCPEPMEEDSGRYLNYLTFGFEDKTPFEFCRIVIKPDGVLHAQPHLAGVEEYITVFAGRVEITAEGETFILEKGDSLRFCADAAHSYKNVGEGTAEMSMIIYYNE